MEKRLAIFIDGENVSAGHFDAIRQIASRHGTPDVLRVYGNVCVIGCWYDVPGCKLVHSGTGKNATDLLLATEAVELALSGEFATVVIASSDRDFTHLALRLEERGLTVVGTGSSQTPEAFRAACSQFEELAPVRSKTPCAAPAPSDLDHKIRSIICQNSQKGSGMPLSSLGVAMGSHHGVRISTLPDGSWRQYFVRRPQLFDLDPRGPDACVRFRPKGFSASR